MQLELGFSLFDWVLGKLPDWIKGYIPSILQDRLRPIANEWQTTGEKLLSDKLQPIVAPLKPVIKVLTDLKGATVGLFDKITKLTTDTLEEYNAIKNFKEDLHWRGRVVNAPEVVKKIKRLTQIPIEVLNVIKDLVRRIKDQVPGGSDPAAAAEDAVNDLEGFRGAIARWAPKFAKGAEKLLGVVAILVECLIAWNAAIDDLQTLVNDVKEVRLDIEKLDLIFLPQNNPRRYVKLEDGRTIRIRVGGHLHPK